MLISPFCFWTGPKTNVGLSYKMQFFLHSVQFSALDEKSSKPATIFFSTDFFLSRCNRDDWNTMQ